MTNYHRTSEAAAKLDAWRNGHEFQEKFDVEAARELVGQIMDAIHLIVTKPTPIVDLPPDASCYDFIHDESDPMNVLLNGCASALFDVLVLLSD